MPPKKLLLPSALLLRQASLRSSAAPNLRPFPMAGTRRWNTSQPSPHASFYKTFGRPIAKVFLMAVFTYQLAYYAWTKLEHNEIRAEREAEVKALEEQVKSLQASQKAEGK